MFIHFYPDADALCDGCDQIGTIVSLSAARREHHLNLCSTCFRAAVQILNLASTKLRLEVTLNGGRGISCVRISRSYEGGFLLNPTV